MSNSFHNFSYKMSTYISSYASPYQYEYIGHDTFQRYKPKNIKRELERWRIADWNDDDAAVEPETQLAQRDDTPPAVYDQDIQAAQNMMAANGLYAESVACLRAYVLQHSGVRKQLQAGDGRKITFPETLLPDSGRTELTMAETYTGNTHLEMQPLRPDGSRDIDSGFSLVRGSDNNAVLHVPGDSTPIHDPEYGKHIDSARRTMSAYLDGIKAPWDIVDDPMGLGVPELVQEAAEYDTTAARFRRAAARLVDWFVNN